MNAKNTSTVKDVEKYLAAVPKEFRLALERLRQTIKSVVPDATEVISYQVPTFKYQGRMLVSYAAFADHCSFFPGAGPIDVYQNELKTFPTSKGTIRFTPDKQLSTLLIKKLVKTRISQNEEQMQKRAAKKVQGRKAAAGAR